MLQQVAVQLGGFPISLMCLSNGTIGFMPNAQIGTIYTSPEGGLLGSIVTDENIKIFDNEQQSEYSYNQLIDYKHEPLLLKWLQGLELIMPTF